jgi:hypothetical protein
MGGYKNQSLHAARENRWIRPRDYLAKIELVEARHLQRLAAMQQRSKRPSYAAIGTLGMPLYIHSRQCGLCNL